MIVALFLPAVLLRIARVPVPSPLKWSAGVGLGLIPVEITIFLVLFNLALCATLWRGIRARSAGLIIEACILLPLANLLMAFTLVTAVRAFWLR